MRRPLLASLAGCVILANGCSTPKPPLTRKEQALAALEEFQRLEEGAARFGQITAGAPRAYPYGAPELEAVRERLIRSIEAMLQGAATAPKPEVMQAHGVLSTLSLTLKFLAAGAASETNSQASKNPAPTAQDIDAFLEKLVAATPAINANALDIHRFQIDLIRYLLSRIEDATLPAEPYTTNFERVVIDVQLTAFVRPEHARAAMVYFDLYPSGGDAWAHIAGEWLESVQYAYFALVSKSLVCDTCTTNLSARLTAGSKSHTDKLRDLLAGPSDILTDGDHTGGLLLLPWESQCCAAYLRERWSQFVKSPIERIPADDLKILRTFVDKGWDTHRRELCAMYRSPETASVASLWKAAVAGNNEEFAIALQEFRDRLRPGSNIDRKTIDACRDAAKNGDQITFSAALMEWWDGSHSLPAFIDTFPVNDYVAHAHRYLARANLLPRLVHVEVLGEGELVADTDMARADRSASVSAGWAHFGAVGDATRSEVDTRRSSRVHRLSLAFAVGDRRAGWCFFPSETEGFDAMKPTERRIQMVVDVPKGLRAVDIHVHKTFLDSTMQPLANATLTDQFQAQNRARAILSIIERSYPPPGGTSLPLDRITAVDFPTATNWAIMKSRLRNAMDHYWGERLTVPLPGMIPSEPNTTIQKGRQDRINRAFFPLSAQSGGDDDTAPPTR